MTLEQQCTPQSPEHKARHWGVPGQHSSLVATTPSHTSHTQHLVPTALQGGLASLPRNTGG